MARNRYSFTGRRWALPFAALLTSALILGSGCRPREAEAPTAQVVRRDIVGLVTLNGEAIVPPGSRAEVLPPYHTKVAKVYAVVGQSVKKGDVLLEMAAPQARASYQQNREAVKSAEAALAKADQQYSQAVKRAQEQLQQARQEERKLQQQFQQSTEAAGKTPDDITKATEAVGIGMRYEQAVTERKEAEQALQQAQRQREAALEPYKQRLEAAQAAFGGAQGARKATAVRAPISGEVLEFTAQEGGVIGEDANKPIAVIVDLDDVKVHAPMTPAQAAYVKKGTPARMAFPQVPNETFNGEVENVDTQTTNAGQALTAVISFRNEKGLVKPGMKANVTAEVGEVENVLVVPNSAVVRDDAGRTVVRVRRNDNWETVAVEVGVSDATHTEIKSGLNEGETVQLEPEAVP